MVIVLEQSTGTQLGKSLPASRPSSPQRLLGQCSWHGLPCDSLFTGKMQEMGSEVAWPPNGCYRKQSSPFSVRQRIPLHPSQGSHILMSHWPLWPAGLFYSWLRYPGDTSHTSCTHFRNAFFGGTPALGDYRADGQSLLDPWLLAPKWSQHLQPSDRVPSAPSLPTIGQPLPALAICSS